MKIIKKLSKSIMQYRSLILAILDMLCIIFAYYIGTVFFTGKLWNWDYYYIYRSSRSILISLVVYELFFHIAKIYNNIIRYEDGKTYFKYILLCICSALVVSGLSYFLQFEIASIRINFLAGIFIAIMMISYRFIIRQILIFDIVNKGISINKENQKNILIIGAGNAAHEIIKTINTKMNEEYNIVGIIDDNNQKLNLAVSGVKIVGNRNDIKKICKKKMWIKFSFQLQT